MKIFLPVAAVLFAGSIFLVDALDAAAPPVRAPRHDQSGPKVPWEGRGSGVQNPEADARAVPGGATHRAPSR